MCIHWRIHIHIPMCSNTHMHMHICIQYYIILQIYTSCIILHHLHRYYIILHHITCNISLLSTSQWVPAKSLRPAGSSKELHCPRPTFERSLTGSFSPPRRHKARRLRETLCQTSGGKHIIVDHSYENPLLRV